MENWAYGFNLNHEGAGVGIIYYSAKYFERKGIVNPANAKPYSSEEIDGIKNGAIEGATNYTSNVPENALVGITQKTKLRLCIYSDSYAQQNCGSHV